MSSTRYIVTPSSNFQLITKALQDYAKQTGIDLAKHPSAKQLELLDSPDAILQIFQERENAFKSYRDRNRTLINCLRPAVKALHAFSGVIGDAASLVSHTCLVTLSIFSYECCCVTSPGSFPTSKSYLYWNRRSVRCTYYPEPFSTGSLMTYGHGYGRLLVGSVQAMIPSSTSLTASGISSSALIFIPAFHPPR